MIVIDYSTVNRIFGLACLFWGIFLTLTLIFDKKSYKQYNTFGKCILASVTLIVVGCFFLFNLSIV